MAYHELHGCGLPVENPYFRFQNISQKRKLACSQQKGVLREISALSSFSSKSAMARLTEIEKKAYYTLVEQFETGIFNEKGCCFLMNFQPDPNALNADQIGELMWVTSCKFFDMQYNQTQKKKFFVERMIKSKSSSSYELDMDQAQTSASGISFIKCSSSNESLRRNFLTFGCWGTRPNEVFAYLYGGKKDIRQLRFVKSYGTETYTLDTRSSGNAFTLRVRDAVGAPVIHDKGGNQVVGLLNLNEDGTLYPVFFDLETFKPDKGGATKRTPSRELGQDLDEKPPTGTTGDQTDSEVKRNDKGPPSADANKDEKDSPTVQVTDMMTQINLNDDNRAGSSVQVEVDKAGSAGPFQKQVTTVKSNTESYRTDQPVPKCIKNLKIGEAPRIYSLRQKLRVWLDPEAPRGNDYRELADSFNPQPGWITFLGTRDSPTLTILEDIGFRCTIWELREKLRIMQRIDAVEDVDKYIKNQNCKCEDCSCELC